MDVDITARKAAEARLRTLAGDLERQVEARTRELAEANRELEAFSYSVSHDLRSPLRHLDGFASLLAEELGPSASADAQSYMKRIRASAQRMSGLINDLLALARISRLPLARARVNLSDIAREISGELAREDPSRRVAWWIAPDLVAYADPGLARLALENLLGNAWKYTARCASGRIEFLEEQAPDGTREFVIRDNGAGFDMDHAALLFKPFHRLHGDEEFKGSGIGLATVHRIVERHGGRIRGSGQPGRGAQFRFRLEGEAPVMRAA
jgi:signal transduction histidine kinase